MKTIRFYLFAPIVFPVVLLGAVVLEIGIKLLTIYRQLKKIKRKETSLFCLLVFIELTNKE
ncbi:hypothetical protein [Enterococcus hirae]|uniref:hypothetical protein n=1 Tax=Enterococcus hirae TaxID=1354 RepID=UPI00192A0903|nr:hypothetical protein [Enterococcus hirae]NBA54958.1 hypothetical protein [Enterococcus hirae]